MTTYEWDTRCADLELDRLQLGFTPEDFQHFAGVLLTAFARTQADVHVKTGQLLASGDARVETASPRRWTGEISYGGGAVRWAASEFFGYSDKHGGYPSHAYFRRVGWQPRPRYGNNDLGDVPWVQGPISNVPTTQGVRIEDDMLGPVTSFFARGRRTPHPEGPIR